MILPTEQRSYAHAILGLSMAIWPFSLFTGSTKESAPKGPADPNKGPTLGALGQQYEKRYKREVWWLENRSALEKGIILFVILVEVVLGLIGLWAFVDYFVIDYVEENRLVETFFVGAGDLHSVVQAQVPSDLQVGGARVVSAGGVYDVIAIASNPNEGHVARVSYRLAYDDRSTEQRQVVIMQGMEVPLVAFEVEAPRPRNPQVLVDNVEWWRIDAKTIPDPVAWRDARLNLQFEDLRHDNDVTIGDQVVGRTTASLRNATGFGFYEVEVYVVLKRGGSTIGVNRTQVTGLEPREERPFQLDWFGGSPSAQAVEVYPVVNLFDDTVYLPEEGTADTDRRDIQIRRF